MNNELWKITVGEGPLVAAAIHDGHALRSDVAERMALSEAERLREEDPFTGEWAEMVPTRVVVRQSRFEMDLNRPREKAVYVRPEDAWGLHVWNKEPAPDLIAASLAQYDAFYQEMHRLFSALRDRYGQFVVFDLHAYNHRRGGPDGPEANPEQNPEVNLGTGTMTDRARWGALVERFRGELHAFDFLGRHLDVRENIKFRGGYFPRWIHETFAGVGCVLSIEFKKFFMDEWTGEPDPQQLVAIRKALAGIVPGIREERSKDVG
jgi:N-formylglutamate deformylase